MPRAIVLANSSAESLLAAKLMEKAKIEYKAVHFDVGLTDDKPVMAGQRISKYGGMEHFIKNRVEIEKFDVARDFYSEIFSQSGYESGPCLTHNIFTLRLAKKYMEEHGYDFIVTGDVLDQCHITQTKEAFEKIDFLAGVEGFVFRPLSAALLSPTDVQGRFRISSSVMLSYRGEDTGSYPELEKEFDLFDLPAPETRMRKRDAGCHEEDMGRKAFELFERGFGLNISHLRRLGLHLTLEDGSRIILGRTPFESTYLNLFYQRLNPENAVAFSLQEPRYTFGFIYGPDMKEGLEYFAAKVLASTIDPVNKPKDISFFDSSYAYFGTKTITPIPFQDYAHYIDKEHSNELSCPIFTRFSVLHKA